MKDFSLNSGERQTGSTLDEIRYDHRLRYELAIEFVKNQKIQYGLDLFCGNGYGTFYVSSEIKSSNILGIDGSREAIEFAQEHYSNERTFFSYKLFPFCLPKEKFDFITCFESIEHVREDALLLDNLINALRPGGLLFLSVPNDRVHSIKLNPHPFHFKHYKYEDIISMVNERLDLITWFGQNVYKFNDAIMTPELLIKNEMKLNEKKDGQVTIFVFLKRKSLIKKFLGI